MYHCLTLVVHAARMDKQSSVLSVHIAKWGGAECRQRIDGTERHVML